MSHIAVLGTGLLGAGMVENLLAKGHQVRVWNRTAAKTAPLVAKGATAAASAAEAVRGADRVHLVLAEDDAVDAVIAAIRSALAAGAWLIDHSTNLPKRAAARMTDLRGAGIQYVSAPVFMSPQNAREASGMMVVSAPQAEAAAIEAMLAPMTAKVLYVGEEPHLAAVFKLAGNSMYFALTAAMADVFAIGAGNGVPAAKMLELFDVWKVGGALPVIGKRLADRGNHPASFELTMARKDARLMAESAGDYPTLVLPGVIAAMDAALARGHGDADFAVFAKGRQP
jgi:3-hydroxyisobutyrate dehydrogenase-like beta-hydroxyacid dehydrogenase